VLKRNNAQGEVKKKSENGAFLAGFFRQLCSKKIDEQFVSTIVEQLL